MGIVGTLLKVVCNYVLYESFVLAQFVMPPVHFSVHCLSSYCCTYVNIFSERTGSHVIIDHMDHISKKVQDISNEKKPTSHFMYGQIVRCLDYNRMALTIDHLFGINF
eukprot:TRINITY_DN10287_c5_g1_i2.p1 TRINITY_DN10287_c5_g1~~TRINITY_DN10287_c5_g1_i2.p1  ORF type:complete len:108 (+),score=2.01 TRINITY_DN10287_c5_g1_i2:943-1266(+)